MQRRFPQKRYSQKYFRKTNRDLEAGSRSAPHVRLRGSVPGNVRPMRFVRLRADKFQGLRAGEHSSRFLLDPSLQQTNQTESLAIHFAVLAVPLLDNEKLQIAIEPTGGIDPIAVEMEEVHRVR